MPSRKSDGKTAHGEQPGQAPKSWDPEEDSWQRVGLKLEWKSCGFDKTVKSRHDKTFYSTFLLQQTQ